jgi:hypothetical protein
MKIQYILLIFGIIFLIVLLTRRAIKKVYKDREAQIKAGPVKTPPQKPVLTEEQFAKVWKNLSYLLLLAAAGSLYMVYTSVRDALIFKSFIFWIDAGCSLAAAIIAVFIWRLRTKRMVYLYFAFTIIPIFMFMSIKGNLYKQNALIHLFPLVLLYFVLKPVWSSLKE